MNIVDKLNSDIQKIINELGYDDEAFVTVSNRKELGDYQYNGAMKLAKVHNENPRDIATKIVDLLKDNDNYTNINIAGPGFINISISNKALVEFVNDISKDFNKLVYKSKKKTIFMDYGGANIAKELHVGHMRSANIGEALNRLFKSCNIDTISDVHLGDWGRPMGLIMLEIKKRMPDLPYFDSSFDGEYPKESPVSAVDLSEIYPIASGKAKEDESYMEEARDITLKLQNNDPGYTALWKHIRNTSVEDIKELYDLLNAHFDLWEGESDSDKYIDEMIEYLEQNKVISMSEGAEVIFVDEPNDTKVIPPLMVKKSNGGVSYDSTELATLYSRIKRFKFDEVVYLTDVRQQLHFVQTFRAAYKSRIIPESITLTHLSNGTICGKDGTPFKTRDGGVMSLRNLYKLVYDECYKKISDNVDDKEKTASIIAIAAIKYADLLPNRTSDYVFDPIKFSDLNGKTGPYILYNTVRIKSILSKLSDFSYNEYRNIYTPQEREIILTLLELKNVLKRSVETKTLNEICEYIFKLTNIYNSFYSENYIVSEEDLNKKESWSLLSSIVLEVNKFILNILAIDIPEKM